MPRRKCVLANGEYYHVFNRSINKQPVLTNTRAALRAIQVIKYYLHEKPPLKFSRFIRLPKENQSVIMDRLGMGKKLADMVAYCLMPNHFHFLLKQLTDVGIPKFVSNFQNSYAKYFNKRFEREGPLWKARYGSVHIEDEEQLLHVSRYIHLNPYTSFVVKDIGSLFRYPFSSLPGYLNLEESGLVNTKHIFSYFKNAKDYKKFVLDNADYQRRLDEIKHLMLE